MLTYAVAVMVGVLPNHSYADHEWQSRDYWALCYHDIRDNVRGDVDDDPGAVSTANLIAHFDWLKKNHYHVISLDDVIAAKAGKKALPENAVMITFDDGYASFYHKVFPLLKMYNYPATLALVGHWLNYEDDELVPYGDELRPREDFLTWDQIQELADSPLVELASHSYNLHRGVVGNPQMNVQAAAVTRIFDDKQERYENDKEYRDRIFKDLKKNQDLIKKKIGQGYRAMVWPYGRDSGLATEIARDAGMPYSFVLDRPNNHIDELPIVHRLLIDKNPDVSRFEGYFQKPSFKSPKRVVHVDLDYVYDEDPAQQSKNLDQLLDRIRDMHITTVYLQAYADADGDGNADALYFPNRHLPVKADLFNRVAWQLITRAEVNVYAWMPVSAFIVDDQRYQQWAVYDGLDGKAKPTQNEYRRLSIFHPEAKRFIHDIYADLGKHTSFNGLLFHDDGYLSDYEDLNPAAIHYYQRHGLADFDLKSVRRNPAAMKQWTTLKTQAMIDFTLSLAETVERYRPRIKTARNVYARVALQTESEEWFAQNLQAFEDSYDYSAIMAMPFMENANDPKQWLERLVSATKDLSSLDHIVFELQAVDWRDQSDIPSELLVEQMQQLQRHGAINFGYYPDNFIENHPQLSTIKSGLSLEYFPYPRP